MQPRFSMRNYVSFIVAWMGLTILYVSYIRPRIYPPEPPKPVPEKLWLYDTRSPEAQAEIIGRMSASPGGRGLADAVELAAQYAAVPGVPKAEVVNKPEPPPPAKVEEPKGEPKEVTLGGDDFAITATLTDIGAGVRELILNDFPAADRYGLPLKRPDGTPQPVTLIPRQLATPPAFAVFHYASADENREHAVDTLGRIRWAGGTVDRGPDRETVAYTADVPEFNLRLTKTFSLAKGEYHVGLALKLERIDPAKPSQPFRYQLAGASGLPIEGVWYATTFRNAFIGLVDDRDTVHRVSADSTTIDRMGGTERIRRDNKRLVYAAVGVQYFASAIAVDNLAADGQPLPPDRTRFLQFARATLEAVPNPKKPFLDDITVRAISEPVEVGAQPAEHRYLLYHGPMKVRQLSRLAGEKAVSPALVDRYADALHLSSLTDYGSFGFWTTAIIFFTNLVHGLLGYLHHFLPAGLAILAVTFIVRICMFPIGRRQAVNMQRNQAQMEKLKPEMDKINKQYKDDPLGKQAAMSELMRRNGINPMAQLGGCLMIFLQMPIFMGLYFALQESVFFRLEPFLWIRNLAAPDMLFWWGETIPYLTNPEGQGVFILFLQPYLGPYFNLLPVIGLALIMIQQKLSMPKEMTDEQRQTFTMMRIMMFLMLFMFYRVPAGLSLYFIASSLWGLTERKLVKQHIAKIDAKKETEIVNGRAKAKPKVAEPGRLAQWWAKLLEEAAKKQR